MSPQPQAAVGAGLPRVDARLRVTGGAKYAADNNPDGVVHAVIVESSIGRGRVTASTPAPPKPFRARFRCSRLACDCLASRPSASVLHDEAAHRTGRASGKSATRHGARCSCRPAVWLRPFPGPGARAQRCLLANSVRCSWGATRPWVPRRVQSAAWKEADREEQSCSKSCQPRSCKGRESKGKGGRQEESSGG